MPAFFWRGDAQILNQLPAFLGAGMFVSPRIFFRLPDDRMICSLAFLPWIAPEIARQPRVFLCMEFEILKTPFFDCSSNAIFLKRALLMPSEPKNMNKESEMWRQADMESTFSLSGPIALNATYLFFGYRAFATNYT